MVCGITPLIFEVGVREGIAGGVVAGERRLVMPALRLMALLPAA